MHEHCDSEPGVKCQPKCQPLFPLLQLDLLLPLKMVDNHIRLTYNDIHKLIGASSAQIQEEFAPDVLIAIGSVPIMAFLQYPTY